MAEASKIATRMLTCELPSAEIAEIVFRSVGPMHQPVTMITTPNADFVKKSVKKDGWQAAVTHAQSSTDPVVLATLAKDSRKQVRRVVAANPHTTQESLRYLFDWAIKEHDEETMNAVSGRVDLMWALEPQRVHAIGRPLDPWAVLARRVLEAGDEVISYVIDQRFYDLDCHLAASFMGGRCQLMSLRDFAERYDDNGRTLRKSFLIRKVIEATGDLDVEMAELLIETGSFGAGTSKYSYGPTIYGECTVEALDVLINSAHAWAWVLASQVAKEPHQLDQLIVNNCESVYANLWDRICADHEQRGLRTVVSAEQLLGIMTGAVKAGRLYGLGVNALEDCPVEILTPEVVMFALANSDSSSVTNWMSGHTKVHPLPGQIREFIETKGHVLYAGYSRYSRASATSEIDMQAVARHCRIVFEQVAEDTEKLPEWLDELIDALGVHFFEVVSYSSAATQIFIKRMRNHIGDDPQAWALAMNLLSNQNGSLDELCASVRLIVMSQGIEVPELISSATTEEPTLVGPGVQLSFLG